MRAALFASWDEPLARGLGHSASRRCGGQKVRNSPGVDPRTRPVLDDPVDGGDERFAIDVVLELVAVVFLRAAKSATANLGLGAPGGDPGVAPGA